MKAECHILTFNEASLIRYTLRHYATYCSKLVVHDAGSTDSTVEICRMMSAEVLPWDTKGELNDEMAMDLKNECWKGTDADWVIVVDADELLYFPKGVGETLATYSRLGAAIIKAHGFDMYSVAYPTTRGQIYDEVKLGAPSDKWYGKPVLFSPRQVEETGFGIGAHESDPLLRSGRRIHVGADWPKANPPAWLLHFHHGIGPIERIARRLDEKRTRLAAVNRLHGWGNLKDGMTHALEKQEFIKAGLVQVIP